jgi:hypothetical protein
MPRRKKKLRMFIITHNINRETTWQTTFEIALHIFGKNLSLNSTKIIFRS